MEESTLNSSNEKMDKLRKSLALTAGSVIQILFEAKQKSDKDFGAIDLAIGGLLIGARKHLKQLPPAMLAYMNTLKSPSDRLIYIAYELIPMFLQMAPAEELTHYADVLRPHIGHIHDLLSEVANETQD